MEIYLLLSALSRPPRLRDAALSRRTGMLIPTISRLCRLMTEYGWIDSQRRLTDEGAAQLRHARKITMTAPRSEEHTSELQSLMRITYAVFCLKKKTQQQIKDNIT